MSSGFEQMLLLKILAKQGITAEGKISLLIQVLDKLVNPFESLYSPGLDILGSFLLTLLPPLCPEVSLALIYKFLGH
jgi:hypothetical protein